ncbi:MAG TPA: hypothetical protein VM925_14740, partial [Labilithrix sp.]|nr:hypothetical protein [Labilithrix sp.]
MPFLTRLLFSSILAFALVFGFCHAARADGSPRSAPTTEEAAYEEKLREELRSKAPELVPIWDTATADRNAGHAVSARDGYARIVAALPSFDHAHRRLCSVEVDVSLALAACRRALELSKRWENHAALAARLATDKDRLAEARSEADKAEALKPREPSVLGLQAELALATGDGERFRRYYDRLVAIAPEHERTLRFGVVAELVKGDADAARAELARAKAKGAVRLEDERALDQMIERFEDQWTPTRIAKTFVMALGVWLLTILALFGIGSALSRATLRHTEEAGDAREAATVGGTRTLKRIYRAVITVAGIVYWLSLPFVALLVLGG